MLLRSRPYRHVASRTQSTFWARELVSRMALPRATSVDDLRTHDFGDIVRAYQSMMWRAGELFHLNSCYAPTVDDDLIPQHPLVAFEEASKFRSRCW